LINKNFVVQNIEGHSYVFKEGRLFFFDTSGNLHVYEEKTGTTNALLDYTLNFRAIKGDKVLLRYRRTDNNLYYSSKELYLYDLNSGKIIQCFYSLENIVIAIWHGDVLIGHKLDKTNYKKNIYSYSTITDTFLWRYDVTEIGRWREWYPDGQEFPGEIRKFIGVWQEELLVALTNHTIIALDIHTGELKRKWRDVPEEKWRKIPFIGSSNQAIAIPYPEGTVLDSEGGKLVGASGIFYWEIDLHTGALLFEEFSAEFGTPLDKVKYSFMGGRTPALSGDHLFLIGERYYSAKNGNDSEVIAFNRKTHTIDWRHTFPLEEGVQFGLQSPVLEGNRLYVLDTSGTLHIFERTN
jgi:hypothetical protein